MTLNPLTLFRLWLFNRSRFIFSYWNGSRIVKGDPMVLWRSLQQHDDYREEDFKLMKVPALREELIGKIAAVVRSVFNIRLPNDGGLTELECFELLRAFIVYTGFQKKSGDLTQSLPTTSEPTFSPSSTEEPSTRDDTAST
jgi:hypothetical protein